jgi:hypothetical protein
MFEHGALWGLATILGPILLLAALAYGVIVAGRRSRASQQKSDAGAQRLYDRAERQERREESESPSITPDAPIRKKFPVDR